MSSSVSVRKPHNGLAGYVSERRNRLSGGYTILLDCALAERQGAPLVVDYQEEGGRYQIVCNDHGAILHTTRRDVAYAAMRDASAFCDHCRTIAAGQVPCTYCGAPIIGERCSGCHNRVAPWLAATAATRQGG